uniref:Uncharacterized protein n=1 Tax=Zonotrichia albicollis TaxID=44394 RepID=A0A8D2N2E3_ZONAL
DYCRGEAASKVLKLSLLSAQVLPKCVSGDARTPWQCPVFMWVPGTTSSAHGVLSILNPGKGRRVQGSGCSPAPLQLSPAPPLLLDAVLKILKFLLHLAFLCGSEYKFFTQHNHLRAEPERDYLQVEAVISGAWVFLAHSCTS